MAVCFNSEDAVGLDIEVEVPDLISLNNSVEFMTLLNLEFDDDTFGDASDVEFSGFGELILFDPAAFSANAVVLPDDVSTLDYCFEELIILIV